MTDNANRDFDGDVVLITGAGAGLGRAYALYLATRGADVVVNDIDQARADGVVEEICREGGRAVPAYGSVAQPPVAEAMVRTAQEVYGRLDALVNNAGIGSVGRLSRMSEEDIRRIVDVQLFGTIWATRAALGVMETQGSGRIVVTSSGVGAFGSPRSSVYGAAKAGVIGLMRSIALDVADTPIRINAISPIASTGLSDGFFRHFPELPRERYTAELVAPALAYLCHRNCRLNGISLTVGGGRAARIATTTATGLYDPQATHEVIAQEIQRVLSLDSSTEPQSSLDEFSLITP